MADTVSYDHLRIRPETGQAVRELQRQMKADSKTRVTMSDAIDVIVAFYRRHNSVFPGFSPDTARGDE
jgi:hypothetical protein